VRARRVGVGRDCVTSCFTRFRESRFCGAATYGCTNCLIEVCRAVDRRRRFVTAAVIDGVAVTPPIYAAPGCGGEFASTTRHRFCVLHFAQHGVCGVVSGSLGEGSCGESMAEIPLDDWVGERRALSKVACRGHSFVEAAWRREKMPSGAHSVKLRAAGMRGRDRRLNEAVEKRHWSPVACVLARRPHRCRLCPTAHQPRLALCTGQSCSARVRAGPDDISVEINRSCLRPLQMKAGCLLLCVPPHRRQTLATYRPTRFGRVSGASW
jgi:hypothetical protein